MESKRSSPENLAFTKNFSRLVASEAYAANLIPKDLKDKCTGEVSKPEVQTRELLNALQGRLESEPETLQEFAKILENVSGLDHIGKELLTSLDEAKRQERFTTPIPETPRPFPPSRSHTSCQRQRKKPKSSQEGKRLFTTIKEERSLTVPIDTPPPTPIPQFSNKRVSTNSQLICQSKAGGSPPRWLNPNTPAPKRPKTEGTSSHPTPGKENDHSYRERRRSISSDNSDYSLLSDSPHSSDKSSTPCMSPRDSNDSLATKYQRLLRKYRHETRTKLKAKDCEISSLKDKLERTQSRLKEVKEDNVKLYIKLQPVTDSSVSPSVSPYSNKGR